jgi:hypothetical protein
VQMAHPAGPCERDPLWRGGLIVLRCADGIRLMIAAARLTLRSEPEISQFERPSAHGRRRGRKISQGEVFVLAYTKKVE